MAAKKSKIKKSTKLQKIKNTMEVTPLKGLH